MTRSWQNENTVAGTLAAAGFYPTDQSATKQDLQAKYIAEQQIMINDKAYTLSQISQFDVKVFADELDSELSRINPFFWDLFAKYAVNCLDAVRLANNQDKQGYRGSDAKGNELDANLFIARMFYDPDNSTFVRTAWDRVIAATGTKSFFEGATAGSAYAATLYESLIILGWYNPADTPCSDAFQITQNTDLYDYQTFDFEEVLTGGQQGDVLYELKEPWTLPPNEAGHIDVSYYRTGTDGLRPIGLWIKEAKNVRNPANQNMH